MSRTHMNRLSRAEKALGMIEADTEPVDGDPVAGRKALRALLATRLGEAAADARLAEIDQRPAAPARRLSEAARQQLLQLRARGTGRGPAMNPLWPDPHGWHGWHGWHGDGARFQ